MNKVQELRKRLETERPASWKEFPDIGLYMDQVISYMRRQSIRFDDADPVSSAMINNYIKAELLPRANGKRYRRLHLALLTGISTLKQVLTIRDVHMLLKRGEELTDEEEDDIYTHFQAFHDVALNEVAAELPDSDDSAALIAAATRLSVRAYANRLAAERLLEIVRQNEADAAAETK
jgi:Domain of unknown function (DUF1836).